MVLGVPFFGLMAGRVVSLGITTISINYEINWQEWAFGTNFDCDVSEVSEDGGLGIGLKSKDASHK